MLDKETLYRLYVNETKTGKEIAEIAGVKSNTTIYNWLRKYGIPRRDIVAAQRTTKPSKQLLYEMYVIQEMTLDDIAEELGIACSSASRYLKSYKIPARSKIAHLDKYRGIPFTKERRQKISKAMKGKTGKKAPRYGAVLSQETKDKISNSLKGRFRKHKSPNWKNGGVTEYKMIWRGRYEYTDWRNAVFERDNYTCQDCGKPSNGDIEAHHIIPVYIDPTKIVDVDNGITLCKSCHAKIKTVEMEHAERYQAIIRQSSR